ncbi:hypothetical protein NMY22_g9359 [Coprinellus aureogranulatus]|nr:hypothetical protein NMY22_g9359 [Coprinellus aureogranulatus]
MLGKVTIDTADGRTLTFYRAKDDLFHCPVDGAMFTNSINFVSIYSRVCDAYKLTPRSMAICMNVWRSSQCRSQAHASTLIIARLDLPLQDTPRIRLRRRAVMRRRVNWTPYSSSSRHSLQSNPLLVVIFVSLPLCWAVVLVLVSSSIRPATGLVLLSLSYTHSFDSLPTPSPHSRTMGFP